MIDPARWPEVERILDRVLDQPPEQWSATLAAACAHDGLLRDEVERLLAARTHSAPLLDRGLGPLAATVVEAIDNADPLLGQRLGVWRLRRELGRGGMSRVYLGEREGGTFTQVAAVKVLRAGLDQPVDILRFERERQILASLAHPYIARLLDGGVTPDGRPFLVLEYVDGVPLTTWCESHGLDVRARVRLLLTVAEAIDAAHRRLVVHRDLKPSNILVDADGRPRLLDFGVARILASEETGTDTATRQQWLSPAYAAPEQFRGGSVTTATDVYQLGAVLYEVLSGRRPFDPDAERLRVRVPDDEPPPPSQFRASLAGDLDAIIRMAMRVDPDARYASVAALAADLQRYLDSDAVLARQGDRRYRWRRSLRRRAVPLAVAGVATLVTVAWTTTLAVQNRRIERALDDATAERARAEQVSRFLVRLFEPNDPRGGVQDTVTARTLLARGELQADALADQPVAQAELLGVIGRIRMLLGAYDAARPLLERALALTRQRHEAAHPTVLRARLELALLAERAGRLEDAEAELRDVLAQHRQPAGDSTGIVQDAYFQLANVLHLRGQQDAADTAFARWEVYLAASPRAPDAVLAQQLHLYGEYLAARESLRRVPGTPGATSASAVAFRRAMAMRQSLFGNAHTDVAFSKQRLALSLFAAGNVGEADSLMREAMTVLTAAYPDGHRELADAHHNYGQMLLAAKRPVEALRHHEVAATMIDRLLGTEHLLAAAFQSAWGTALLSAGEHARAAVVLEEAARRFRQHGASGTMMAWASDISRGDALRALGVRRDAERLLRSTYEAVVVSRGKDHRLARRAARTLATLFSEAKQPAEAAAWQDRATRADSGGPPPRAATGRDGRGR
ncbi:MAG: serine/threonine-protein kinase [Gemmatimonadaceae bacterium]|nr:serine/threonine-protein kinase [Gemmatimonadaceae bacterium]